jgi:phosphate starvation-inducible PhoH-like protein
MTARTVTAKRPSTELLLSPVNNKQLANLCGVLDENLRQIETALDVSIARRGERFTLRGETAQTARASEALQQFYAQAKDTLSVDEIQLGLIELLNRPVRNISSGGGVSPALMTRKSELHGRTPRQIEYLNIVFGIGPAGTGKTYLAVAKAVQALQAKRVNRIVLTRPAVEAGERLGFLPGTLSEKIDPYLRPLYDALHDMIDPDSIPRLITSGTIEIAPLAYMRGRTLNDAFIILDEAQNTTAEQMKMFLTRLGFGSTMVVTGDVTQVDLLKEDVVRHPLVARIVSAYEAHTAALEAREAAANAARKHAKE